MRESQRLRRPTQECLGDNVGHRQYNKLFENHKNLWYNIYVRNVKDRNSNLFKR